MSLSDDLNTPEGNKLVNYIAQCVEDELVEKNVIVCLLEDFRENVNLADIINQAIDAYGGGAR